VLYQLSYTGRSIAPTLVRAARGKYIELPMTAPAVAAIRPYSVSMGPWPKAHQPVSWLVGRDRELAALREAVDVVVGGCGRIVCCPARRDRQVRLAKDTAVAQERGSTTLEGVRTRCTIGSRMPDRLRAAVADAVDGAAGPRLPVTRTAGRPARRAGASPESAHWSRPDSPMQTLPGRSAGTPSSRRWGRLFGQNSVVHGHRPS
jgi:hypothetical protein